MDGKTITSFLKSMCRDIDLGRPLKKFRWGHTAGAVAVSTMLVFGGVGCGDAASSVMGYVSPDIVAPVPCEEYAAPRDPLPPMPRPATAEKCDDGVDNDGDGALDCGDPDCDSALECSETPAYAVPFPAATPAPLR